MHATTADLLQTARPKKARLRALGDLPAVTGYVWYRCGGDGYGLCVERGILPASIVDRMRGDMPNPPGLGGKWYSTREAAIEALRLAMQPAA